MYTMKKIAVMMMAGLLSFMPGTDAWAQRQQQTLGRGVVAVKNGSNVFLSWRRLSKAYCHGFCSGKRSHQGSGYLCL